MPEAGVEPATKGSLIIAVGLRHQRHFAQNHFFDYIKLQFLYSHSSHALQTLNTNATSHLEVGISLASNSGWLQRLAGI